MKKIARFLMCSLLLAGSAACSDDDEVIVDPPRPKRLAAPVLEADSRTQTSFAVEWQAVPDATAYVYSVDDGTEQTTASLRIERSGLEPGTDYRVKVKATAEGFVDSDWTTLTVTTLQMGQLADPVLAVESKSSDSFVVVWEKVPDAESYVYTVDDQAEQTTASLRIERSGLEPGTDYLVKVKATAEGFVDSDWTTLTVTTLQTEPLAEPVLAVESKSSDSFVVVWEKVPDAESYVYTVGDESEQTTVDARIERGELLPETSYEIRVKAVGEGFLDSEWATLTVVTDPASREPEFEITVPTEELTGFSARVYVAPKDKEATYFTGIVRKQVWDGYDSFRDIVDEQIRQMGENYPYYLYLYLYYRDYDYEVAAEPETEYVAYVFGWDEDGTVHDNCETTVFTTPAGALSDAKGEVAFSDVTDYTMNVTVTIDDAVDEYYMLISTSEAIDGFIAANGEKMLIPLILQEGEYASYGGEYPLTGLTPSTEYTALLLTFDEQKRYFLQRTDQSTQPEWIPDRVESTLFEELLGTWQGRQTFMDYDEKYDRDFENTTNFEVTIVASVDGAVRDYRRYNELVARFDGYAGINYHDVASLIAAGYPEASAKAVFGPNVLLSIREGNEVRIDGRRRIVVYGWAEAGNTFMTSMNGTNWKIDTTQDLVVEVSDDKNTLTIRSPREGYYPSLVTASGGLTVPGLSEIVLTRTNAAPRMMYRQPAAKADRARLARRTVPVWTPSSDRGHVYRPLSPERRLGRWNRMSR